MSFSLRHTTSPTTKKRFSEQFDSQGGMKALVVALAFAAGAASAQEATIVGAGTTPCSDYLAARVREARSGDISETVMHISWSQGFLTAMNQGRYSAGKPVIPLPSYQTLIFQLEKACRDDPAQKLHGGAMDVWLMAVKKAGGQ